MAMTFGIQSQGDGNVDNNTSYTDSTEHGGATPDAAIMFAGWPTTPGTVSAGAGVTFGVADGTNEFMVYTGGVDAVGSVGNARGHSDALITWLGALATPGSRDGHQVFSSFSANTATLDTTNTYNSDYLHTVLTMDDVTVHVGDGVATDGGDFATTLPGFTPDLIFFFSDMQSSQSNATTSTDSSQSGLSIGVVANDGSATQRCMAWAENAGLGTTAKNFYHATNRVMVNPGFGTVSRALSFTSFDANGFSLTHEAGGSSADIYFGWIALKFNNSETVEITDIATPTSTGTVAYTTTHQPDAVFLLAADTNTVGSVVTDGGAGAGGFGVLLGHADQCISFAGEDAADTTNEQTYINAEGMKLFDHTGTEQFDVDGPVGNGSFNATDFTLDYINTRAAARAWVAVSIGTVAAGGTNAPTGVFAGPLGGCFAGPI